MRRKIFLVAVGAVLVTLVATVLGGTSAFADTDEYLAERRATFAISNPAGQPGPCRGEVWIGLTTSGLVEGTTTVRCSGQAQFLEAQVVVYAPGEIKIALDEYTQCGLCRGVSVAYSERGGRGWCVRGVGLHASAHPSGAGSRTGQGVVCV
jgi:hypothetical protein